MRRLLFRTCSLPMIAFAALALFAAPDRANGTQAEALGESFHADQYPSRRAAIADLAKQVADELKSRPKTPAQIPDAQVQLRERSLAWTRDPHAPKVRLVSALVTIRVGLVLLRREFHVPYSAPDVPARTQEDELMKA